MTCGPAGLLVGALCLTPVATLQLAEPDLAAGPAIEDFTLRTQLELELYTSGVRWEGRALEARDFADTCLERLAARTSSVAPVFIPPPPPTNSAAPSDLALTIGALLIFTAGALLGVLGGLGIAAVTNE